MPFVAFGSFLVPLKDGAEVRISVRVKQEIATGPASREWSVVIVDRMGVEELANVVCVQAGSLQPYRKPV